VALYLALLDFLVDPGSTDAKRRTTELGQVVLTAIGNYEEAVDTLRTAIAGQPILPYVIIAAYSLPDTIEPNRDFTLFAKAVNASPTTTKDVTLRLRGGEVVPTDQSVSVGDMAGTEEKEVTFRLRAVKSGAEVLTLETLSGDSVMSTQLVYVTVSTVTPPTSEPTPVKVELGTVAAPTAELTPVKVELGTVAAPTTEPTPAKVEPKRPSAPLLPCLGGLILGVVALAGVRGLIRHQTSRSLRKKH
jgi:hypothetical protein